MKAARILLVEDSPDDEALALRALRKVRAVARVDVAKDGIQALDYLFGDKGCASNDPPQLVLLDLKLPKMSGLEVLRRIRKEPAGQLIPIVVLTSSRERNDLAQAYRAGANSYIRKPVNFEEFDAAVKLLAQYWLGLNEVPYALG